MNNSSPASTNDGGEFLVTSIEGLTADSVPSDMKSGLPLGYAYLIRSNVSMPELYPFLGELLFGSCTKATTNKKGRKWTGVNVIGMFVDDHRDTLFMNLNKKLKESYSDTEDFFDSSLWDPKLPLLPRTAAWMDTFGKFKFGSGFHPFTSRNENKPLPKNLAWHEQSTLGAGNPMSMFRFISKALECRAYGDANLYLLNSLSNLYRNLGLSETRAFLKEILNKCIWSPNWSEYHDSVGEKQAIFFAVLQTGVMSKDEENYFSSFFDGIINVVVNKDYHDENGPFRVPTIEVEALPLSVRLPRKIWYIPKWHHEKIDESRFEKLDGTVFIKAYREK